MSSNSVLQIDFQVETHLTLGGNDFKPKIECIEEMRESFFKNIYFQAAQLVNEIAGKDSDNRKHPCANCNVDCSQKNSKYQADKSENQERLTKCLQSNLDRDMEKSSRVIVFDGERGTGKSSVMLSFAKLLEEGNLYKCIKFSLGDETVALNCCHFETIGIIDPSLFEKNDNLLENVIAKMFAKFHFKVKKIHQDVDNDEKRNVLKQFQAVYENLKTLQRKSSEVLNGEYIEVLADLSSGTNLRESFGVLVKEYLNFIVDKDVSKKLLLVIDDFDLAAGNVYEIAEHMRKYLNIKEMLVLVAVNINQLTDAITLQYFEPFQHLLTYNKSLGFITENNFMSLDEASEYQVNISDKPDRKAEHYVRKLFPEPRRLNIPIPDSNNTYIKI